MAVTGDERGRPDRIHQLALANSAHRHPRSQGLPRNPPAEAAAAEVLAAYQAQVATATPPNTKFGFSNLHMCPQRDTVQIDTAFAELERAS